MKKNKEKKELTNSKGFMESKENHNLSFKQIEDPIIRKKIENNYIVIWRMRCRRIVERKGKKLKAAKTLEGITKANETTKVWRRQYYKDNWY